MEQSSEQVFIKFIGFIIKHRILLLIFSIIIIIFIITISVSNINLFKKTPDSTFEKYDQYDGSVSINNLSQYQKDSIPQSITDTVNREIAKTIKYNTTEPINTNEISDISVRQDSYSSNINKKNNTHFIKYFIDIPSLQQSYRISYNWIPDDPDSPHFNDHPIVSCPTSTQLIYGEFDCKDLFLINDIDRGSTISGPNYNDRFLSRITPYKTIISNNVAYSANVKYYNDEPYIEISFNACDMGDLVETAKISYNNYLQKYDLKLSDFKSQVVVSQCDH